MIATSLADRLPRPALEAATLAAMVGCEVIVGLAIGAIVRLALAALQVAGSILALQSGLAAALWFDPSEAGQGTVPGALLSTLFLTLLVMTDAHHVLLARLLASYETLPAGVLPDPRDLLALAASLGNAALGVGLAIAAPVLLVSFLANLALGVLARLVPALQVLFVALPVQLLLALSAMAVALGAGLQAAMRFLDRTSAWLAG